MFLIFLCLIQVTYSQIVKKIINKLKDKYREKQKLTNHISVRSVSYSIKQFLVNYKSKLLNLNLEDCINLYPIRDVSINVHSGVIQKNNIVLKKYISPILYESLSNTTFHTFIYGELYKFLKQKEDLLIKKKKDLIYLDVKRNKNNYYHFVHDNLLGFIFVLENYKGSFELLFNRGISTYINEYVNLLSQVYKKKINSFKNKEKIRIKNRIIFAQNMSYHKISSFDDYKQTTNNFKKLINPKYNIYNIPTKYFSETKNETININQLNYIVPRDFIFTLQNFIKKLLKLGIIKKKIKKNYYCKRLTNSEDHYRNRLIENEKKFEKYLLSKGFETVVFDKLPITKQIEIGYNSKTLIGLNGANLTNSIFKKNGNIIEIFSGNEDLDSKFYKNLAEQKKLNYYRLCFKKNNKLNTIINYTELDKLLKKIK